MELLTVVIIVGILAAFAVPNYINTIETQISAEGISTLTAIRASQERHRIETGAYANSAADLDIGVGPSTNFSAPSASANVNEVGAISRMQGATRLYTIHISNAGTVVCCDRLADNITCAKLGIPAGASCPAFMIP